MGFLWGISCPSNKSKKGIMEMSFAHNLDYQSKLFIDTMCKQNGARDLPSPKNEN